MPDKKELRDPLDVDLSNHSLEHAHPDDKARKSLKKPSMTDEEINEMEELYVQMEDLLASLLGQAAKQKSRIEGQAEEIQELLAENEALSLRLFNYEEGGDHER